MDSTEIQHRLAELEERVRLLEDEAAIRQLMFTWGPAVDTGSSEVASGLWAEDGVLETDMSHLVGPREVAAMVESEGHQALVRQGAGHVQGYPIVTVDGDRATATGYSRVYLHTDSGYEVWRLSANHWQFVRTPNGWRVSRRTNHVIDGGPEARVILSRALGEKT